MQHEPLKSCLLARFWHDALKKHDPVWVLSGVCPLSTRHDSRTWKELVAMSIRLQQVGIGGDVLVSPQAVCFKGLNLWNAGVVQPYFMHCGLE